MSTFIIAEAGSTHEQSLDRAYSLAVVARDAGADAVKYQYWSSPAHMRERRHVEGKTAYLKGSLKKEWLDYLHDEVWELGIEFMCTVYLPEDIPVIAPYVKRFKVASFESADREFIEAHRKYGKELIVSTGMGQNWGDDHIWGDSRLHCVSAYPCPPEQANIAAVHTGGFAGYSDHTHDILTGALAVAAGARILEVHFRLDDTDPASPDYATALPPGQLKDYISLVRKAELMMGDGIKRPQPAEAEMMKYRVKA